MGAHSLAGRFLVDPLLMRVVELAVVVGAASGAGLGSAYLYVKRNGVAGSSITLSIADREAVVDKVKIALMENAQEVCKELILLRTDVKHEGDETRRTLRELLGPRKEG